MPSLKKIFDECIGEMFHRVGLRYTDKFVKQDGWYRKRSWSESEESEFREWMVELLRKKCRWSRKMSEKEVSMFLLSYSWVYPPNGCLGVSRERLCR